MIRLRHILFMVLSVFAVSSVTQVCAGEELGKKQIKRLLSGNTVNGYYMVEGLQQGFTGRVRLKIKFFADGNAEKTTTMAKGSHGQFTGKGRWLVNKKGKLCLIWAPDNKKKCGRLLRTPDGKYELQRKQQKFYYEEIVAGH